MQWLKKLMTKAGQQQPAQNQNDIFFRHAIDSSPTGWMLINKSGDILYVNRALDELFASVESALHMVLPAVDRRQLTGKNFNQLFRHTLQPAEQQQSNRHYLPLGRTFLIADVYPAGSLPDAGGLAVEWRCEPCCSAALSLQQSMQRALPFFATDLHGQVLAVNAWLSEQLACPSDQAIGCQAASLLQLNAGAQHSLQQALLQAAAGLTSQLTVQVTSRQGRVFWWAFDCHAEQDPVGKVCGVAFYARDITAAVQSSQSQQQVITALQDVLLQAEFAPDGNLLAANALFQQRLGVSLPALQGRRLQALLTELYRQQADQTQFWQQILQGEHHSAELPFDRVQGGPLWLMASFAVLRDDAGLPVKVVMYAQDVSPRRQAIETLQGLVSQLAAGDLTVVVTEPVSAEFPQLSAALSQLIAALQRTMQDIRQAAETITGAATEISAGNTDLSSRTEQQASNLEETASSMEELAGTVRQNSDNSRQANVLAAKAAEVAVNGGQLIDQVVSMMSSINESAQKIADIIGVIDGIAFQTNILALNAAVEAARAGEQGRGFAVVAAEVRTLAQRSANAAKDIKALISDSVGRIRSGNELADRSGSTMKDVVTAIKRVNDIMAEIAAASVEQATGLDEISKAVNQMDDMTQQNAALVEQAAAAAESLLSQAEQLTTQVSAFQTGQTQTLTPTRAEPGQHRRPRATSTKPMPVQAAASRGGAARVVGHKPLSSKAGSAAKPSAPDKASAGTASARLNPALLTAAPDGDEWESF